MHIVLLVKDCSVCCYIIKVGEFTLDSHSHWPVTPLLWALKNHTVDPGGEGGGGRGEGGGISH